MRTTIILAIALLSGCSAEHKPLPDFPQVEPHEWRGTDPGTYEKMVYRENMWRQVARECGRD